MKYYSIKKNYLFSRTFKLGAHKSSSAVTVYVLRDKEANTIEKRNPMKQKLNRVGITVSKKLGNAVKRNRAKRLVREAMREIDKEFGMKRGYLIVVVPHKLCTVCKTQKVQRDMLRCLTYLGIVTPAPATDSDSADVSENGAETGVL